MTMKRLKTVFAYLLVGTASVWNLTALRGELGKLCLTALLMWWATATEAMAVQIFVLYPNNQQRVFEVELSDSIDLVKELVQDRLGAPPDRQYLYFDDRLLQDGRTLSDYNVQGGSILPLVATWSFGLPLPLMTTWAFGISDVNAGPGSGWTRFSSLSTDFTGYGTGSLSLDIHGYAESVAGTPVGYDPLTAYDWTFLTASEGITGFSADMFSMTGDFASRASVNQVGNNLVLHVAAVPEPSTCALLILGGAASLWALRRRKH